MKHYYLIFALLFSVTGSFAQTLEDDRLALIAFYQSTNGDGWTNKTGWNPLGTTKASGSNEVLMRKHLKILGLWMGRGIIWGIKPIPFWMQNRISKVITGSNNWIGTGNRNIRESLP